MRVIHFSCGQAANESELKACALLKTRLQEEPGDDHWILLSNLAFSVTHALQSDEIDLVVIGPPGVRVVEVKHWTLQWADANQQLVEQETDRVTNKARKIGTTLRKVCAPLPRVDGTILLTQEPSKVKGLVGREVRGVRFHSLSEWKSAIDFDAPRVLSQADITRLGRLLEPKSSVAIDGSLRRLAGYVNLELQTPKTEQFHRVYKGAHPARRDRVVLHLYDRSASDDKNAEAKARREFDALHRLQIYGWAPRILDSFQDVPGYPGEMYFFTLVDPAAPCLEDRATDPTWHARSRVAFARNAMRALRDLHTAGTGNDPIVHRNLTPHTILVKHDNTPIFTGFERSKIPSEISVASAGFAAAQEPTCAPEVRSQGLAAADQRSDVYSLCACLVRLFQNRTDDLSQRAAAILERGLAEQPHERHTPDLLDAALGELLGESVPPPPAPPARFWTEDQVIRFRDNDYRIVARLGSGGVGTTFKVVHVDRSTGEELGTYVAKVAHDGATGERVLRAYSLVRSHLRHTALSTVFEVAKDWQENQFIALMTWVSGAPLSDFIGVFPLLAEEQQEPSSEALAVRWLRVICEALDVLHRNGLVHGDVSPRNLIVSGSDLVLTDYDFVGKLGEPLAAPGTVLYCSPSHQEGRDALPSDDLYALAATFFHVLFEREPFRHGKELDKRRGLNWEGIARDEYPVLAAWLDRATHPDAQMRFASVAEALQALAGRARATMAVVADGAAIPVAPLPSPELSPVEAVRTQLREERVLWLLSLLQSYPGSRWGNRETRGLDTEFASQTYVETPLEETLLRDIRERRVRLVILCGNAGDGKTALLQHLAERLGLGRHQSSERVLEARLADGLLVRMNLDGSASWQGHSADELLDAFLAPFQGGPPAEDIVHLLAINDGRLLEWIEGVESRQGGETPLTAALYQLVQREAAAQESHIRFVSLNQRSLVGGIDTSQARIDTTFLDRLIDQLYGGAAAPTIWAPCQSCSAMDRCEVLRATKLFGPSNLPVIEKDEVREWARQRLFEALQAVHLRGETHITVRELRAALVYVMFGTHYCDDYHANQEIDAVPYWDRAFSPGSPSRQGEVLAELARFDPALEAHPQIDRYLQSKPAADTTKTAPHYPQLALEAARRRAFFEWTRNDLEQVAGDPEALDLARGQHLRAFRNLALEADPQARAKLCEQLCAGISRLEDLPPQALDRQGVVPLRVTPRTPTETAFWVEKPLNAFRLEVDLPPEVEGMERLHRHVFLVYRYRTGEEERLRLGADLFHLLLELADGYQLGDVSTGDTFAHLSIFVQRLAREDERELLAWNPMQDETLYRVQAVIAEGADGPQQRLVISPLAAGGAEV
ncbi:protein kinase domain-containing protein [Kallotenue papyrolyticum]|uniref:protein kinase domain-containing protein n=1 Tax=Kallotenue papyrolyticum TaxID=1325125 RepID=UPI000492471C|nr:NERD domain-containing protein [Kallotenue papyrolyticum]